MRRVSVDEFIKENPRKNANWLSALTFWYTMPIFRLGRRRDLEEFDLTKPLDEHKSSLLGDRICRLWMREVERSTKKGNNPSMEKVILKCFFCDILIYAMVLMVMELGIRMLQPIFLGLLLRYFNPRNATDTTPLRFPMYLWRVIYYWSPNQSPIQKDEAIIFACCLILVCFIIITILHPYQMAVVHVGMRMRIACCSLLYRKALRLSLCSLSGRTVGNVMNLMSNDVNRFDTTPLFFHYLWISPIQMAMITYFMYKDMNISAVLGMIAIMGVIPLQAWFGRTTAVFRLKTALRTDERVRQMNEIIAGIQVIKMYTWEYAFSKLIYKSRKFEIQVLKYTSYVRGLIMSFIMFTSRFGIFLTVISYVLYGHNITAEKVFVITSYYMILRQTMTVFFPQGIAQLAEAHVALTRIERFMLLEETEVGDPTPLDIDWKSKPDRYNTEESYNPTQPVEISIKDAYAKYGDEVCLKNIVLEVQPRTHIAIIGQVGCGKTCLLNLILGELLPYEGTCKTNGVIAYAAQEPWLFAGSVRQNILFGRKYDRIRYQQVVRVCALLRDFSLLPYGDKTIVGERGISLSGGQRARVNLARAVYRKADIYLLDDPLSAVDAQVCKQIFEECILGFLNDKIVILATHQLQFMEKVDKILVMDQARIIAKGNFAELKATGLNFAMMMEEQLLAASATVEEKFNVQNIINKLTVNSQLSMTLVDPEGQQPPKEIAEMRTYGSVECSVYKEYFKAGGNWCIIYKMGMMFLFAQFFASAGDYFVAQWVKVEEARVFGSAKPNNLWMGLSTKTCMTIYASLVGLTIFLAISRSIFFYTICMRASVKLHDRMFQSISKAVMRFFNTNTSGRILNRFSKDMGAIDEFLPNAMIDCTQIMLNLIGAVVVLTIINLYLLIPTVVVCITFYVIRRYYLKTGRSVKRLEGITRSPVFAHLNATLQGLTTIRSNGAEITLASEFDRYQDTHSSAWFLFIATSRAFGYCLDLICVSYIGMVTFVFVINESGLFGGEIGLAITQLIGLIGIFQWGMKQSAELENQMTSVERVLEFTRVEHEPALESAPGREPPLNWPHAGHIEFQKVYMTYSISEPPVLKDINFVVQPKEKIGIVGRTGAGKSSLMAALFRLAYFQGEIIIDGVNVNHIGLHDLRRKISIIPQEPVIFSGTMRYNLDPFKEYSDEALLQALLVVEMKIAVSDGIECLHHVLTEGGANLSVGERQMICLARAIVRNNVILMMDEATANVDAETDKFIQKTIREKFSHCTVLTIAHRLHTVMDSDRVLVMDAGSIMELNHPHTLLSNKKSYFSQMVERTGPGMAASLRKMAETNYVKKFGNKT